MNINQTNKIYMHRIRRFTVYEYTIMYREVSYKSIIYIGSTLIMEMHCKKAQYHTH